LLVEKFIPKPLFELEAVEFTGGIDQGRELMIWIIDNGGQAVWMDEEHGEWNRCGMREHLRVIKGSGSMFAYVGDYIIRDIDGEFKPLRRPAFLSRYTKVAA
jgi:hypothetical protein